MTPDDEPLAPAIQAAVTAYDAALQRVIDLLLDLELANKVCGCGPDRRPFTYVQGGEVYDDCLRCGGRIP